MRVSIYIWSLGLLCLLGSHVSGLPSEMQSDDWRVSTILESTFDQYVKPYTGPLVEKVTSSPLWNMFGNAFNKVQGAINLTGEYLHTYYEDHLRYSTENTLQWIENKTQPWVESVQKRFGKEDS